MTPTAPLCHPAVTPLPRREHLSHNARRNVIMKMRHTSRIGSKTARRIGNYSVVALSRDFLYNMNEWEPRHHTFRRERHTQRLIELGIRNVQYVSSQSSPSSRFFSRIDVGYGDSRRTETHLTDTMYRRSKRNASVGATTGRLCPQGLRGATTDVNRGEPKPPFPKGGGTKCRRVAGYE